MRQPQPPPGRLKRAGIVETLFHVLRTALALVLAIGIPSRPASADDLLELEVLINGYSTGKIAEFMIRGDKLASRRQELEDLGIRVPASVSAGPDDLVPLSALPGLRFELNKAAQTLTVNADINRLEPTKLQVGTSPPNNLPVESGVGATVNYDATVVRSGMRNVATSAFDSRIFSPWGVASSGVMTYLGGSPAGPGRSSAMRLDSSYVYSSPEDQQRYTGGDFINGGLGWSRPVRMGGIQFTSDFSMRPDLVTFPLPTVSGAVAVPSTLDLMVNGSRVMTREIQAGPFMIPQLPVMVGGGTIAMTLTDALGNSTTTRLPFYASQSLLAEDLDSFSFEAGVIRRNWGMLNDSYDRPAGSGTYRRGISSVLTMEAHAEGMANQAVLGGGLLLNVFNFGLLNASVAASSSLGRTVKLYSAGFQHSGSLLSFGASATISGHDFRDVAAASGDPVPRSRISANASLSLGKGGSVGVAYSAVDRDAMAAPINFFTPYAGIIASQNTALPGGVLSATGGVLSFQPSQHVHVLSTSYAVQVWGATVYATGFHDLAKGGSSGVLIGLTLPLGNRGTANASVGKSTTGPYGQLQVAQTPESIGDWGYQASASSATPTRGAGELQYKSPVAYLAAGADRIASQSIYHAQARGALSFVDGGLFASNTISDSFAVVDTDGAANVRVLHENREVGRTDDSGHFLVTDLRAFDTNHLGIDPTDVTADANIAYADHSVRPQDRSGIVVRFPIQASHGALLRLVDKSGAPVAIGSVVTLQGGGATAPVGYDGNAYVLDLQSRNRATVALPNGDRCVIAFDFEATPGDIPVIGPIVCQKEAP